MDLSCTRTQRGYVVRPAAKKVENQIKDRKDVHKWQIPSYLVFKIFNTKIVGVAYEIFCYMGQWVEQSR